MKYWKCPECFGEHESEDNVVMSICPACIVEMKPFPHKKEFKLEVENDNTKRS